MTRKSGAVKILMSSRIPASKGDGALGTEGGVEAADRNDPASLEAPYAIRSTVTFPLTSDRRLLPTSEISVSEVTLTPEYRIRTLLAEACRLKFMRLPVYPTKPDIAILPPPLSPVRVWMVALVPFR